MWCDQNGESCKVCNWLEELQRARAERAGAAGGEKPRLSMHFEHAFFL